MKTCYYPYTGMIWLEAGEKTPRVNFPIKGETWTKALQKAASYFKSDTDMSIDKEAAKLAFILEAVEKAGLRMPDANMHGVFVEKDGHLIARWHPERRERGFHFEVIIAPGGEYEDNNYGQFTTSPDLCHLLQIALFVQKVVEDFDDSSETNKLGQ